MIAKSGNYVEYCNVESVYYDNAETVLGNSIRNAVEKRFPWITVRKARKAAIIDRIRCTVRLMGAGRFWTTDDSKSLQTAFSDAVWNKDVTDKDALYEAKQRQRQMETAMRAQREKVQMLQNGGADRQEVMLQKAKYQGQLNEYAAFSRKMGLKEERERIYLDMRGKIATNNKTQNKLFPPEMIQNASKDIAQYKRYKEVLGDSVGTLAKFGQVKYNDSEEWEKVQSKFFTYLEIDKKDWSEEFKNTSKQAYDRFAKENVVMSVHALSRLPRLNKPGLPEVSEEMLIKIIKGTPNYTEGEDKQIYFSHELQLLVVRNKKTGDIVSVVRRRAPKEACGNV